MTHRGPDGSGHFVSDDGRVGLGHRRLSIVDLADTAAQPMSNEDGTIWGSFNGEIYNHLPLRAELVSAGHRFRSDHSDTEVLVHGYEQWGLDGLLERIEGDFAIALWDQRKKRIFLVRDRAGVKPLYFAKANGKLFFASEIKAILAQDAVPRDIEPVAMYHYLSFLAAPAPLTMFRGVFKLPAGYYATIGEDGQFSARRYWNAVPNPEASEDLGGLDWPARERRYVTRIRELLDASVRKRMMADVPMGVLLSGGVDSSTIVSLMARDATRPVETFSVGFKDHPEVNELQYARSVASRFGTHHHEVMIGVPEMRGYLESLIHHQDEPIADPVCIPLYFVSKLARDRGVKVVQVGEGSDEQFCGYAGYMGYLRLHERYWSPFRRFVPSPLQRVLARTAGAMARINPSLSVYADIIDRASRDREHFWSGATVFWENEKRELVRPGAIKPASGLEWIVESGLLPRAYLEADSFNVIHSFNDELAHDRPSADVLMRMIYNEFKLRLPELLLMRVDKIAMSTSVEARVPFLDHALVEYTMGIPMGDKVHGNVPKYLLKQAVRGLIPSEIIDREKMGFSVPMADWLRGEFGAHVRSRILASGLLRRGYFERGLIERLLDEHRSGVRDNSRYVWTLFNLTSWYDYWIEKSYEQTRAASFL